MNRISSRADIELLIDRFYEKVIKDELIGFFFNSVIKLDWAKHIPIMYDFWETTLLGVAIYKGNPMLKHIELHAKQKLKPEHFDRWLHIWEETIKENFEGDIAENAVKKANQIGELMKIKIDRHDAFNKKN